MRKIKYHSSDQLELADVMYALSDPARIEIIKRLSKASGPMTCGELNLERPKSSMSHHFRILREVRLVETKIEGKEHFNTLKCDEIELKFPGLLKSIIKILKST